MANDLLQILLIEDNPADARLIHEMLTEDANRRYEIEWEKSLGEGLGKLNAKIYDVVLLDLALPDSDGLETFKSAHAAAPEIPFIVLSSIEDETMSTNAVHLGAQDYLVKGEIDSPLLWRVMRYAIERKQHEEELYQERFLLKILMDNIPDRIYFKDRKSCFIRVNRAMADHHKFKNEPDAVGKSDFNLFSDEHAQSAYDDEQKIIESGNPLISFEEKETYADQEDTWVSTTKMPLVDRNGTIQGTFGISRDITNRKKAQQKINDYHRQISKRNEEMQEDLQMAREIQEALITEHYPVFPPGADARDNILKFCHRYIPAESLAGDFFDIFPITDMSAGILICDVMGHGLRASLITAYLRGLADELAPIATNPGRFLKQINNALIRILKQSRRPMFASAFFLMIDLEKHTISYANAGHPNPILRSQEKTIILNDKAVESEPALGLIPRFEYTTGSMPLNENDTIFLFTDGIYEVEDPENELFGLDRLCESIEKSADLSDDDTLKKILIDIRAFGQDEEFQDDICLVSVRLNPKAAAVKI